jgi:mRNA interferase RelE/StbE
MASFRVEWKKSTKKDLRRLPASVAARVVDEVAALGANPFPQGVEKLSGSENAYRIRLGDYRVVYNVFREVKLVEIQRVRHRKDVYRG